MPRESFQQELDRLVGEILVLGREVEAYLGTMVEAMESHDASIASRELGVDRDWLYRRLYRGTLAASRHPTTGHYLFPDEPQLLDRLRAEVARNSHR